MSRVTSRLALVLGAVLCASLGSRALAQQGPASASGDAATDTVYQELIAAALEEYDRDNWAEARHLFLEAHERRPTARTMRGLGIVAFELRRYVECIDWLERALASQVVPLTERQRQEVEAALERARGFVGRYVVTVDPESAQVTVDGDPLEEHPDGMLWLDVGEHELRVSAAGYTPLTKTLSVVGGKIETLELRLERPVPALALSATAGKRDSGSVLETWWFWSLTAVVIGGGVGTALLLTHEPPVEPAIAGDDGVIVHALTIAR